MKLIASSLTVLFTIAALAGCDNSADRAAKEAAQAQEKADKTAAEAMKEARDKTAEAYGEANRKIANEQANADDKANEARKTFVEVRTDLHNSYTKDLAKLDKRIVDLRTRIETSKVLKASRADLDKDVKDIQIQSDQLRTKTNEVPVALEANVDTVKKDLQLRLDNLGKSIDALEHKLDGKS